jgi:hypothetical protein
VGDFDLNIVGWDVFGPWDVGEGQDGEGGATAGMCPGTHFDAVIPCVGEFLVRGRLWTQFRATRPRIELGESPGFFRTPYWDVISLYKIRSLPKRSNLLRLRQLRSSTQKLTATMGRY